MEEGLKGILQRICFFAFGIFLQNQLKNIYIWKKNHGNFQCALILKREREKKKDSTWSNKINDKMCLVEGL